ncbi:MAG: ATP-binding cassette domain-containing protein [Akkermansiaceae bacterium]|nr:ATP-binding cassette domain-containing protein [Akkermansiaceae bacterium]MCF7731478.1 ATP-binding cassette domain-containing protein [Akkermansiaceae bacterium]
MNPPILEIRHLDLQLGGFRLADFNLEVAGGECVALMGPSGCGKTTLLETICGLHRPAAGTIHLAGRDITHLPPGTRGIGLVPQDIALFPSLTVAEQLAFGPKLHRWPPGETRERVLSLAKALDLTSLLGRGLHGLSGGEARRVALGRALALRPRLLCLDEALSGLDETLHGEILAVIRDAIRREGVTALHVTHSSAEAAAIADRVVRMQARVPDAGERDLTANPPNGRWRHRSSGPPPGPEVGRC